MTSTSEGEFPRWVSRVSGSEMQEVKKPEGNVSSGVILLAWEILWILHNVETKLSSNKMSEHIPKEFELSRRLGLKKGLVALEHLLNKMGLFLWSDRWRRKRYGCVVDWILVRSIRDCCWEKKICSRIQRWWISWQCLEARFLLAGWYSESRLKI